MIIDSFMINNELDMLECRLTELESVPGLIHLAVEADVDHQNKPKPYTVTENIDRFEKWWDRLIVVRATDLPTDPDPWSREHAQREWIGRAIDDLPGIKPTDVVIESDVDEIPRALQVRNARPGGGLIVFQQRFHPFCVDWLHPERWPGPVAGTVDSVRKLGDMPFTRLRDARLWAAVPPGFEDAGWHFTWVGQDMMEKVTSFCHPEVLDNILQVGDRYLTEGWHVDGRKLEPVDVDASWPKWITAGNAPQSWYRQR